MSLPSSRLAMLLSVSLSRTRYHRYSAGRLRPRFAADAGLVLRAPRSALRRSFVRPLFLSWAISHGNWPVDHEVTCNGHFLPDNRDILRCWIYRPPTYAVHGPLGPVTAIGHSCNIYFYTIARTLGLERVKQAYSDWGMGHDFALGMRVHDQPIEKLTVGGEGELVMLGIGQGVVAWTPLHAAAAYAALAIHSRSPCIRQNRPIQIP